MAFSAAKPYCESKSEKLHSGVGDDISLSEPDESSLAGDKAKSIDSSENTNSSKGTQENFESEASEKKRKYSSSNDNEIQRPSRKVARLSLSSSNLNDDTKLTQPTFKKGAIVAAYVETKDEETDESKWSFFQVKIQEFDETEKVIRI